MPRKKQTTHTTAADATATALQAALHYLARRARSEAELRAYLRTRDFSPAAVDQATARLRSLRYLNDDNFAKSWASRRAHDRGYGPRRIADELTQKGIDPVLVRQVVRETFAELDEVEAAKRLLGKRFTGADLTERKTVRRAAAFLLRHGYSSETVFNLLGYSTDDGNA